MIQRPGSHTYRHCKTWPDSKRWELIEGQAWNMSPAPKSRHQALVGRLYRMLGNFLEGKTCRFFVAPFYVLLPEGDEPDDEVDTVVRPDIVVFCDRSKIAEDGARGAPDPGRTPATPSACAEFAKRILRVKARGAP